MQNFDELGLPEALKRALVRMKFSTPTPIQAQAIPSALEGKDVLGSAQTGTGKTAAFGIPLVAKLMTQPRGSALVMTPTRELAQQVIDTLEQLLGERSPIRTALLIGGESMPKQIQALRARPRLIVGTPGRINDHLERGTLMLADAGFLVLDETDRMLDMGFAIQIERVLKFLPPHRQTLMFSATLPPAIIKMAQRYMKDPVRVSVGSTTATAEKVSQELIEVSEADKYSRLIKELDSRTGSIIVFVKTKWGAEKLAIKLSKQKHSADSLHGDLRQNQRDRVISAFRDKRHRILVATDIASRGLDIPHVEHVINYDLPQCPEDYIHRIGRTARAGADGAAITLLSPADNLKWRAIRHMLNPDEKPTPGGNGGPSGNKSRNRRRKSNGNGNGQRTASNKPHSGNGGDGTRRRRRRGGRSGQRPGGSPTAQVAHAS